MPRLLGHFPAFLDLRQGLAEGFQEALPLPWQSKGDAIEDPDFGKPHLQGGR